MRIRSVLLAALIAVLVPAAGARAAVHVTNIGAEFDFPVYVTAPPTDPHRLMVVEKAGVIRVIRDGVKLDAPFLNIISDVTSVSEQGLLGLAFPPDYATSRKFYVYYTGHSPRPNDGNGSDIVIEEFTAPTDDQADPSTRRRIVTIPHPTNGNHNGGTVQFGPDGRLYAATGDGGSGGDPPNNAQNQSSLLGKVLRIDPVTGAVEVYALGLRNPFRFSFDRQTGDLLIGDVGQDRAEEIDLLPAGSPAGTNFGWRCFEGFQRTASQCDIDPPANYLEPIIEKLQPDGFNSIIGGYVVRDPGLPDLFGRYVYGDNNRSQLRAFTAQLPRAVGDEDVPGLTVGAIAGFGEDSCGHVYAASLLGQVYRIDGDAPPTPCPEEPTSGAPGGGGAGGNGGGGNGSAGGDATAPRAAISRVRLQRVLAQKGFILSVGCDEACGVTITGKLRAGSDKRRFVLKRVTRLVAEGRRSRVRLRFSSKAAVALNKAFQRFRKAYADVTITARDTAGNERVTKIVMRARR